MPEPRLALRGVTKSFGEVRVLHGINLVVQPGEMVCLIGASGSGKSTLLRCMNGLEPVDDGEVRLDGVDIAEPGIDLGPIRQKIGIVFQSFNLFPHMTAYDNVALAPRRVLGEDARERIVSLFARFGLGDQFVNVALKFRQVLWDFRKSVLGTIIEKS